MIKPNDLKDILHRASLDATKPQMDEVWDEVLSNLDEQMPVKKRKRRFFFLFFLLSSLSLISSIFIISKYTRSNEILADKQNKQEEPQAAVSGNNTHNNTSPSQGDFPIPAEAGSAQEHKLPKDTHTPDVHTPWKRESDKNTNDSQGRNLSPASNTFAAINTRSQAGVSNLPKGIIGIEPFIPGLDLFDDFGKNLTNRISLLHLDTNLGAPKQNDTTKPKDKDSSNNPVKNMHHFAIGGSLVYSFNNFTSAENRSSHTLANGVYQFYKQLGLNLYCRIPMTLKYQVQPEISLQPYSTDIQINYRTPGQNVFTRYNLKRMVYAQVGISNYLEIRKNLYLTGGLYYSYAMPVYGAQLEKVSQGPNKMEEILSSSYERKDFRKNVFGLRRSDCGLSGGVEYHMKKYTGSLRVYRGFRDVTPETPSIYHNFNISLGLGYHFELKGK
jgi:hypothetical protein